MDILNNDKIAEFKPKIKLEVEENFYNGNEAKLTAHNVSDEFNQKNIKDEYFIDPQSVPISCREIDIKYEDLEEEESLKYGNYCTKEAEKKFVCDKCSYKAKWKSNLMRHVFKHDRINAPKYYCNQCPYQTIHDSNIRIHLKKHSGSAQICILCQNSFNQKHELDSHYVSTHRDESDKWRGIITSKIYDCPKCNYKSVRKVYFKNHLATHDTLLDKIKFSSDHLFKKMIL